MRGGKRSTSYTPTWKNGKTRTIRVPVALADEALRVVRELDEGRLISTTQASGFDSEKLGQAVILEAIDKFIESLRGTSGGNQYKNKGDVKTTGTRWYFLNKFRKQVELMLLDEKHKHE